MIYSLIAPTIVTTTSSDETINSTRVAWTNDELFEAYMAEITCRFQGLSLSDPIDTSPAQESLASSVKSQEKHQDSFQSSDATSNPSETQNDSTSLQSVASAESIAASIETIEQGDKLEEDMMATIADLYDSHASSDQDDEQDSQSFNMTKLTSDFQHLSILCNAMDIDLDEMEVDFTPEFNQDVVMQDAEHETVWNEPSSWEITATMMMQVDDPDAMDIDWMELL